VASGLRDVLLVGGGGFLGSVARYYFGGMVTQAAAAPRFPVGTLAVNTLGCLAIGVVAGLAERLHLFSPSTRILVMTGLLGGFTTFSAFAYETLFLAREARWMAAGGNVLLQVGLGLLAVWLGHGVVRLVAA
jgi:CrcB protein